MSDTPRKDLPALEKANQNIQDTFLNLARKERVPVTIFLMGGAKLSGKIKSFDKYSVILESNHQEQLIFKHAISTVVVSRSAPPPASAAEA
ncbi:MAG: RNA chaperone Hfq [Acidobacteria bacterium]|nr:RNA chaperone Hfq [Acidobacteriota bacterium]